MSPLSSSTTAMIRVVLAKRFLLIKTSSAAAIEGLPSAAGLNSSSFTSSRILGGGTGVRHQSTGGAPVSSGEVIKGHIAKKIPAFVRLEKGKKYYWCSCGLSRKQPFCDGTHKTMPEPKMTPMVFEVNETKKFLLCRCKQTNNRPYCDLSHIKTFIPEGIRKSLGIKL